MQIQSLTGAWQFRQTAHFFADQALWVPPDWTREVLFGAGSGKSPKGERWVRAQGILERYGVEWPLRLPGEIEEGSPEEHQADALVLCVAKLAEDARQAAQEPA